MLRTIALLTLAGVPAAAVAQTTPTPTAPAPTIPRASVPVTRSFTPAFRPFDDSPARFFANSRRYVADYQHVRDYGRCVTNTGPRLARDVLEAAPNTVDELEGLRRLYGIGRACLPYGYRAPTVFLRGGLAEALYRRTAAADALHAGGVSPAQVAAFAQAEAARSRARLFDDRRYTELANCIVLRSPAAVRAVLLSEPGSDREREAFTAMLAASGGCVTGERARYTGAKPFLRAYLAESAWRWAAVAQNGAPTDRPVAPG